MMDIRAEQIAAFIRTNLLQYPDAPLDLDTSLVDNGSLDSMGSTLLAAFLEQQFGVRLGEADLNADRISTIRKVLALIDAEKNKPSFS
jgi:acyl carrier protein